MRILLIVNSLGRGGAEHVVSSLADEFAQRGHEVKIVILFDLVDFAPSNDRVTIESLDLTNTLKIFSCMKKLHSIVLSFRPDVVNSHLFHSNMLARFLRLSSSVPVIISSAHNTNEKSGLRMLAYRLTDKLVDISTNVSAQAVKSFVYQKAVKKNRMIVMHNGIDTRSFAPSRPENDDIRKELGLHSEEILVIAVGRLSPQKDYPNLLEAFSNSLLESPTLRLLIAGEGPLRNELEEICRDLVLEKSVNFLGLRRDVPQLLNASDIFILSSAWEGFPLVVGEAMSCERLVVATDVGGVSEWLPNSRFVVPPNDPHALAHALRESVRVGAEARKSIGKLNRERIENNFSLETVTDRWLNLYESLITEKQKT